MAINNIETSEIKFYLCGLVSIFIISVILFTTNKIKIEFESTCDSEPVDYEMKNIDECYLTVHNFIRISKEKNFSNAFDFKTYVYSYTKPYLIELLQNNTDDCLCCKE